MIDKSTEPDRKIVDLESVPVAEFEGCFNSFLSLTSDQVKRIVDLELD